MKKFFALFVGLFLYTQTQSFAAQDYLDDIYTVKYWNNPQHITVWVQPGKYQKIAYKAFKDWMKAANGCIRFIDSPTANDANIVIFFSDEARVDSSKTAVGITHYGHQTNRIIIATKMTDRIQMEATILHEIGHALGIMGHTDERNSIMYPNTASFVGRRLGNKDKATIQKMYCRR